MKELRFEELTLGMFIHKAGVRLREMVYFGVRAMCRLPPLSLVLFRRGVRRNLQSLPGFHIIYGRGWDLIHPFDMLNGTDTSGYIPREALPDSPFSVTKLHPHFYGGSQPSIVRVALEELPPLANFTFIDLGAGKGRPIMVASEFPFKEVIGVELSSPLVDLARKNLSTFRQRYPNCAPVRVENGDVAVFPFPDGDLVIFLYNPFGEEVMKRVASNVETALKSGSRSIFVIYYNPVHGACFDASPSLTRYYAGTISYAAEEKGFGPDEADPVVIWQGGSTLLPKKGADAQIRITNPEIRSELAL
jgi:predicted RNA methylase